MCLGIPGQIVGLSPHQDKSAIVDVAGVRRTVNIACIVDSDHPPQSLVGEWVLIHVGFAMSRIDSVEAERTLALLTQLGGLQADLAGAKPPERT